MEKFKFYLTFLMVKDQKKVSRQVEIDSDEKDITTSLINQACKKIGECDEVYLINTVRAVNK